MKSGVGEADVCVGWKDGAKDGGGGLNGGDEGGATYLRRRNEAGASFGDGQESLLTSSVVERATKESREGGKLERIEVREDGKKAGSSFGDGQESLLTSSVVERATKEGRKGRELERIEVREDRMK